MYPKFNNRLQRLALSNASEIEKRDSNIRFGLLDYNPKKTLDETLVRVIIVTRDENKKLPDFIKASRIIDYRGKYIVGEFLLSDLKRLHDRYEVVSIDIPGPLHPNLQHAVPASGWRIELAADIRDHLGIEDHWDGSGVLIGIIDTGIDYRHDDFKDSNGETIIEWIYENESRQWNRAQINEALRTQNFNLVPHLDDKAHGTAVAACAASTGIGSGNQGMAPGASLLVMASQSRDVFSDDPNADYLEAIVKLKNYSEQDPGNRPLIINLSKGENAGPRDGSTAFEGWLDQLLTDFPRIVLCKSAGNDGAKNHHAMGNVKEDWDFDHHPTIRLVDNASGGTDLRSFSVDIFYEESELMELRIVGPDGTESQVINEGSDTLSEESIFQLFQVNRNVFFSNTGSIKSYSILININDDQPSLPAGDYSFQLRTPGNQQSPDGGYHIWFDYSLFDSGAGNLVPEFLPPHLSSASTLNSGTGGEKPLVIGAYDNLERSLSRFSSRGPTRDGRLGVDLVAPGSGLITASANIFAFGQSEDVSLWSGTSFSTPLVAGALALLMQKEIGEQGNVPLADELKQRIKDFAVTDFFTGPTPNPNYGHGKLNVISALYELAPGQAHNIIIEVRPKQILANQPIMCYVQLVDELQRPVSGNGAFEIFRGFGSANNLTPVASGTLETGGMLVSIPAFNTPGEWRLEARVASLNITSEEIIQVRQFLPQFSLEDLEVSKPINTGHTIQYFYDGSSDDQVFLEGFGYLLSGDVQSHHSILKDLQVAYGYINDPDYEFSDSATANLQAVSELTRLGSQDLYPSLFSNDVLKIPFQEPLLFEGNRKFLLEIRFTKSIRSLPIKNTPVDQSHVNIKKWNGTNLLAPSAGLGLEAPVWLIDVENKVIDVWIKSGDDDLGIEPFAFPTFTRRSPDISWEPNWAPRHVLKDNLLNVRVRNRGILRADQTLVEIFWSDNSLDFNEGDSPLGPWRDTFFFILDDNGQKVEGNTITVDIETDASVESDDSFQMLTFIWNPPVEILEGSTRKDKNFIVRLSHPEDPVTHDEETFESIANHNNIAFRRVTVVENTEADFWFRANIQDNGSREMPVRDNRLSPDIIVSHSPFRILPNNLSHNPIIIGKENHVYLKLRHTNPQSKNNVRVTLFWALETDVLTPNNLRSDHIFVQNEISFEARNSQIVGEVPAHTSDDATEPPFVPVYFKILIPASALPVIFEGSIFLVAMVSHDSDRQLDSPNEALFSTQNNVARRLVETLYRIRPWIRDSEADTGQIPSPGEFDNSPDIVVTTNAESNPFANPTNTLTSGHLNHVYVRVRNRGFEVAENIQVQLFWLPAGDTRTGEDRWLSDEISNENSNGNLVVLNQLEAKTISTIHFTYNQHFLSSIPLVHGGIYFIVKITYDGSSSRHLRSLNQVQIFDNLACKRISFRRSTLRDRIARLLNLLWSIIQRR